MEVTLTRALFNQRKVTINGKKHCFVSFEAPLLRQSPRKRGENGPHNDTDRRPHTPWCDLVALSKDDETRSLVLTAVEVKCKSYDKLEGATSIPFGLMESWFYGSLLAGHLAKEPERLRSIVKKCYASVGSPLGEVDLEKGISVQFALLLPEREFGPDGGSVDSKISNCPDAIKTWGKVFRKKGSNPLFSGLWILKNPLSDIELTNRKMFGRRECGEVRFKATADPIFHFSHLEQP